MPAKPQRNKPLDRIYDVFLSHRKVDEALVGELNDYIENELHFEAYVDWKDSVADLDRSKTSLKTAAYLRNVMRHASSLIYVVGSDPGLSRWTPWELGFFDGRQSARRIGIYLPDGVAMPAHMEYLGLYGQPLRKADLQAFLEDATLDVAAMDSAQSDQWARHAARMATQPIDYALSVLQWQLGFTANLLTQRSAEEYVFPDRQPEDRPLEPAAWFGPWLAALRDGQYKLAEVRRQLQAQQRRRPRDAAAAAPAPTTPPPDAALQALAPLPWNLDAWMAAWPRFDAGAAAPANTAAPARLVTR